MERARRAIAVGERVQRDHGGDARIICGLRDDERSSEAPSEEDDRRRGGLVPRAQIVDCGPDVLDLLRGNQPAALAVAEAEAAIVEAETAVPARDERSREPGGVQGAEPEVTRAGNNDRARSRRR